MKKIMGFFIAIACLAAFPRLLAQSAITLSQQDLDSAQWVYSNFVALAKPTDTLYDAPRYFFADGARGYIIRLRSGDIGYTDDPHTNSLKLIRSEYCQASLIVVAHDTAETTVLSPNKRAVFTATQFKIERILKDVDSHKVGDSVTFVHLGGTYKDDQGNLLRVAVKNDRPYKKGGLYLLLLVKARGHNHPSSVYFGSVDQIEVRDGHIFPTKRLTDSPLIPNPARYGESLDTYWKRITDYLATAPCTAEVGP
jgi:hypothetical protein